MKVSIHLTAFAAFATLLACPTLPAEAGTLPEGEINQSTLGGRMLLVRMKSYVVVSGQENQAVRHALGASGSEEFFRAIVMDQEPAAIGALFRIAPETVAGEILARYQKARDQLPGARPR